MSVAHFRFWINGSKSDFTKRLNEWLSFTTEGRRYKLKNAGYNSFIKIQRGLGLLTGPIIFEFNIVQENGPWTEIWARGYVNFFTWFGKIGISESALIGALPRRNGWKDMMKIMFYLGVPPQQPPIYA